MLRNIRRIRFGQNDEVQDKFKINEQPCAILDIICVFTFKFYNFALW
jgi:hypothetical protein